MRHRGVDFDVRVGINKRQWVWVVHLAKPKQGEVIGARERAIIAAQRAIDAWCARNPTECETASAA
jgi:hypothetical protein